MLNVNLFRRENKFSLDFILNSGWDYVLKESRLHYENMGLLGIFSLLLQTKKKRGWGRALGLIKDEGYFLKFQARLKTIESKKLCYIFD